MPAKISMLVFVSDNLNHPDIKEPTLAPAPSAGANIPPAAPVVKENNGPTIRNIGVCHNEYLSDVNKVFCIMSLPEPNTSLLTKKAKNTIINAHPTTYNIC